jgi:hypothetical protein
MSLKDHESELRSDLAQRNPVFCERAREATKRLLEIVNLGSPFSSELQLQSLGEQIPAHSIQSSVG